MKNKLLTLFLAFAASIGTLFAQSGTCGTNLTWTLDTESGTLTISGTGSMKNYTSDSMPWYSYSSSITTVIIEDGVTSIGNWAFRPCSSLTSVTIPNSVTSIGEGAFCYCSSLTSITIPNSVTSIGESAFYNCSSLTSVTIPNSVTSIGHSAFYGCSSLPIIDGIRYADTYLVDAIDETLSSFNIKIGTRWIGDYAFEDCSSLASVTIPNSVTSIGHKAFKGCTKLTSITIPNSVTSIGSSAFSGCSSLTSIIIPNSVRSIGDNAFYNCSSLTSVTIPNSVTSIGRSAFYNCSYLKQIYVCAIEPPYISTAFGMISSNAVVYVLNGTLKAYKSAAYWKDMNIKEISSDISCSKVSPTSASIVLRNILWEHNNMQIVSCRVKGGDCFDGNTLEFTGLNPNREYKDIQVVFTCNTGETSMGDVFFTTPPLELTTKEPKAVSANTAILLAETNMSDSETSCGFEWRRNDAPADMASNQVLCPVANGLLAGRLKGLRDDTYYKYRAFYKSAAGNMYYGDWQYIFTGDVAVEFDPVLYTYAAQFVSDRKATLKGYALPGADDFTEQGFEYWAESRRTDAPARRAPQYAIGEKHIVTGTGISMRVTLEDLDEGTVYKYRTYAKVGGKTLYGAEMTFTTEGEWIEYTLTANSDDAAAGNVTGSGTYHTGTEVSIEAVPATGYRFVEWSDGNTDNPRTVVLTEDMTITALFERLPDALGETQSDNLHNARKYILNGILYIERNGNTNTVQGQRID